MEGVSAPIGAHSSVTCDALHTPPARDGLTDYSPKDAPWDVHRGQSDDVGGIYASAADFERYAARMADCGGVLRFGWVTTPETGETALRLREAHFCRVRHCPVCQWRRSLMWQARFYQSLPKIVQEHPKARWLFLTVTVRNCAIGDLADTLTAAVEEANARGTAPKNATVAYDADEGGYVVVPEEEGNTLLADVVIDEVTRGTVNFAPKVTLSDAVLAKPTVTVMYKDSLDGRGTGVCSTLARRR